jgi:hypothetical protein
MNLSTYINYKDSHSSFLHIEAYAPATDLFIWWIIFFGYDRIYHMKKRTGESVPILHDSYAKPLQLKRIIVFDENSTLVFLKENTTQNSILFKFTFHQLGPIRQVQVGDDNLIV